MSSHLSGHWHLLVKYTGHQLGRLTAKKGQSDVEITRKAQRNYILCMIFDLLTDILCMIFDILTDILYVIFDIRTGILCMIFDLLSVMFHV